MILPIVIIIILFAGLAWFNFRTEKPTKYVFLRPWYSVELRDKMMKEIERLIIERHGNENIYDESGEVDMKKVICVDSNTGKSIFNSDPLINFELKEYHRLFY